MFLWSSYDISYIKEQDIIIINIFSCLGVTTAEKKMGTVLLTKTLMRQCKGVIQISKLK